MSDSVESKNESLSQAIQKIADVDGRERLLDLLLTITEQWREAPYHMKKGFVGFFSGGLYTFGPGPEQPIHDVGSGKSAPGTGSQTTISCPYCGKTIKLSVSS